MTIGEKIRKIRKEQKLTLKYVSEQTGLSIAFLSQLETNKCNATMVTLRHISEVLNVHPGKFFEDGSIQQSNMNHSFNYEDLSMKGNATFIPLKIEIAPHSVPDDQSIHSGYEFVYCLKGTLTLKLDDVLIDIHAGESYMYDGSRPHNWHNRTNETIEFLMVNENLK